MPPGRSTRSAVGRHAAHPVETVLTAVDRVAWVFWVLGGLVRGHIRGIGQDERKATRRHRRGVDVGADDRHRQTVPMRVAYRPLAAPRIVVDLHQMASAPRRSRLTDVAGAAVHLEYRTVGNEGEPLRGASALHERPWTRRQHAFVELDVEWSEAAGEDGHATRCSGTKRRSMAWKNRR